MVGAKWVILKSYPTRWELIDGPVSYTHLEPLEIEVVEGLALIATVGRNLRGRAGISGHLFGVLDVYKRQRRA